MLQWLHPPCRMMRLSHAHVEASGMGADSNFDANVG